MRAETVTLNVPATATTGTPIQGNAIAHWRDKMVQVHGIAGGGAGKIEVTLDGTNWVTTGGTASNMAADGIYTVTETCVGVRFNRSTLGTGTWTATLGGFNSHTD